MEWIQSVSVECRVARARPSMVLILVVGVGVERR